MRKITNSEEANQYYSLVNELIDNYIDKWKIKPSQLGRYFKLGGPKFKSFLEKNKLDDVEGIDKVLRDVIEDRKAMELDGVITFESFNNSESKLNLDTPNIDYERVLADCFHTSVGHIEVINSSDHIYEINDFGGKIIALVLSKKDALKIKFDIIEKSKKSILDKHLTHDVVDGSGVLDIEVNLVDIIDVDKLADKLRESIDKPFIQKYIKVLFRGEFEFDKYFADHFIFLKK